MCWEKIEKSDSDYSGDSGRYMSVGGCLCALRARDVGMWILKNIHLYWIYTANNWGICDIWRVSVRPSGRWVGEHVSVEYIYIFVLDIFCQQLGDI